MKKLKNILFLSALLSMTIFMSCTEDDELDGVDNGDTLANDSTDVDIDTLMVLPVNFLTIDGDTTFLEGGLKYLYGTQDYYSLPMSGMTNDDGSLCMPKTQSFDIFVGGGDFTISQIEEWGGKGEFPAEFGSGSYSAIYFWLESDNPDMADGKYMDVVQWYNQYFDPVQTETEMYEQIAAGMAMSFNETCIECCGQMSWLNKCVGDEIEDWVWDEATEEYVYATRDLTADDMMNYYHWYVQGNDLCELKNSTGEEFVSTWNDEVCAKEIVYDYLILNANMMTVTVDSSGVFSEVWYGLNNVSIDYEGISEGIESFVITADASSKSYNEETGEYEEGLSMPVTSHYAGFIYSEDVTEGEGEGGGEGGCTEECLDIQNDWWVAAVTEVYPEATVIWATSYSCEAYEHEGVIEEGFSEVKVGVDSDGDGEGDCSMTFDAETEELLRNYCENCVETELLTDQTGYWTVYLDSIYSDININYGYTYDCTAQGGQKTLTVYWNDYQCYAIFNNDTETLLETYCNPTIDEGLENYPMNQVSKLFGIEYGTEDINDDNFNINGAPKLYNFFPNNIEGTDSTSCENNSLQGLCSIFLGVDTIYVDKAALGNLIALNENIIPIISSSPNNADLLHYSLATAYENGKVLAIGHEGLGADQNVGDHDNLKFLFNAVKWLNPVDKNVTLKTGWLNDGNTTLWQDTLRSDGYAINYLFGETEITSNELSNTDILILGNDWNGQQAYLDSELSAIEEFVSDGGSLLITGLGWSWPGVSINDAPSGRLVKKGIVKKGLAHKAILDKNLGVKLKADKSKKPASPKKKKARLPFKNR